jgi:hypothetical protein
MEPLEGYAPLPPEDELVKAIQAGTQNRVRGLAVLKNCDEILIMGSCSSFYIKQMAQESIKPKLPAGYRLKNAIIVKPE